MLHELPIDTRFKLGSEITPEQHLFLKKHGFVVFDEVFTTEEVNTLNEAIDTVRDRWVHESRKEVNGIPLFVGKDHQGEALIQRMPFTSLYSETVRSMIRDDRLKPIQELLGLGVRIGDDEKDGCVVNTYLNVPGSVYPRLGWHTDGLRDLFYLRRPKAMLNVGIHLSNCPKSNGGLRLIPGSHNQSMFSMAFRKPYFIDHRPDKQEIAVETKAGDLTIHDGRLWHRVAQSPHEGQLSYRRSMYVPYLTDEYAPKSEESSTPFYHRLGQLSRWLKSR